MTINIILWWSRPSRAKSPPCILPEDAGCIGLQGWEEEADTRPEQFVWGRQVNPFFILNDTHWTLCLCLCVFIVIILSSSYSSHESSSSDLSHQILKSFNLSPHPLIWGQFPPHLVASQSFREILDASNCNGGRRSKQFVWGPSAPCHLHLVTFFTLSTSPCQLHLIHHIFFRSLSPDPDSHYFFMTYHLSNSEL